MKRDRDVRPDVLVLIATAGAHRLALRAAEIDAVAELTELEEPPLDVPRALGIETTAGERAVRSSSGRWLHLGAELALRHVASAAFTPLPVWLPARCHALPLAGAVEIDEGFAFEIDPALIELEDGP